MHTAERGFLWVEVEAEASPAVERQASVVARASDLVGDSDLVLAEGDGRVIRSEPCFPV